MIRKFTAFFLAASLFLPACREDKPKVTLTAEDNAILLEKADEKIGILIRQNLPALFAGVVVFGSDAFLSQSHRLDQANISVLNMFGNTAILLLNSPNIPPLLKEPSVRKIYYLCRQAGLARLDPAFEMEVLRRFGGGKADDPFSFLIRFREPPEQKEDKLLEAAGFTVQDRTGLVWKVEGPLAFLYRLLEYEGILYYENAS